MGFNNTEKPLSSTKPYLLRAFYEWIVDNQCDPYIIVNTDINDVVVPTDYIHDGRIVLNIAMRAINNLKISNEYISFDARFSGILKEIFVPLEAIMAIYANENGRGMVFANEDAPLNNASEVSMNEEPHFSNPSTETSIKKPSLSPALANKNTPISRPDFKSPKNKEGKPHLTLIKS
jgi:stringent starvation protein B